MRILFILSMLEMAAMAQPSSSASIRTLVTVDCLGDGQDSKAGICECNCPLSLVTFTSRGLSESKSSSYLT